ncbi:Fe-S-containing hydro-lyase [Clostridiaceae bacterium OttesenSCG-928-D20]|nr:Fe-S-containing hydro-lyase [Clostridiaceae bacterium OttesenSCG-928-D20]
MNDKRLNLPIKAEELAGLRAGDRVLLSGSLYTARDAAHKRLIEMLDRGEPLPFPIENAFIYYTGPTPKRDNEIIGSAGPTTSYRMDAYTPRLLDLGLKGMIGKGRRSGEVIESIVKNRAVYLAAIGGAGALLSSRILKAEVIAFPELSAEAIRRLEVKDFPATVIIDSKGNNLYELGPEKYLNKGLEI